jgi:hypothetical protein
MGTRGALVFVVDGTEKTSYVHYDSYPSGLGEDALSWLRGALSDEAGARKAVAELAPVPDGGPSAEHFERWAEFHDRHVDSGTSWYALLRHTQGDPGKILKAGLFEPATDFPRDSLFCEWAYVIDFDARTFEVYEGFQQSPPTLGRWIGRAGTSEGYEPVQRVRQYGFDDLPENLADVERDEDDE